jgi:hypothetical protein
MQLRERGAQQPPDADLREAETHGDLVLVRIVLEAPTQRLPGAGIEGRGGLLEADARLGLRVLIVLRPRARGAVPSAAVGVSGAAQSAANTSSCWLSSATGATSGHRGPSCYLAV